MKYDTQCTIQKLIQTFANTDSKKENYLQKNELITYCYTTSYYTIGGEF